MKKTFKRFVSMMLALVMLVTTANVAVFAGTSPKSKTMTIGTSVTTLTDGQIVAKLYGELSDVEKDVLNCTALVGNSVSFTAPDASNAESLIEVNSDTKTVKVNNYTDDKGNIWTPAETAYVVIDETRRNSFTLVDGEANFSAACETATKYKIEVTYQLKVELDADDSAMHQKLLNAPIMLAKGLVNFNVIVADYSMLGAIATGFDTIWNLYESNPAIQSTAVGTAIKTLHDDLTKAGNNNNFTLYNLMAAYEEADNKIDYINQNGLAVKNAFNEIYPALTEIVSNTTVLSMLNANPATQIVATNLQALVGATKYGRVTADGWDFIGADLIRPEATAVELDALNEAAHKMLSYGGTDYNIYAVKAHDGIAKQDGTVVTIASAAVQGLVAQYTVTVQVVAGVIRATDKDTKDLFTVNGYSAPQTIVVADEATANDIRDAAKAILDGAVFDGSYEINKTNYELTDNIDAHVANRDITVTFTYTPKMFKLATDWGFDDSVPYGYNLTLPKHDDPEQSYDYQVNGEYASEGSVIRITEKTEITREEGKAKESYSIGEILAKSEAATLTLAEQKVLSSAALKLPTLSYRLPAKDVVKIEEESTNNYKVTVSQTTIPSGLPSEANWVADTIHLMEGSTCVHEVDIASGGVTVFQYDGTFERVEVNYTLTFGNEDVAGMNLNTFINLPNSIKNDVDTQIAELNKLAAQKNNLAGVDKTILDAALMVADTAKTAIEDILAHGMDGEKLMIYKQVEAYAAQGISYFYQNNNGKDMIGQLDLIYTNLGAILADTRLMGLLASFPQYADKIDMIDTVVTEFKAIRENLKAPNQYIDTTGDMESFLALVNEVESTTSNKTVDGIVLTETRSADAPTKASVNVVVKLDDESKVLTGTAITKDKGYVLIGADITSIEAMIANLEKDLIEVADKGYYKVSFAEGFGMPEIGDKLDGTITVTVVYKPLEYTVYFKEDGASAPFAKQTFKFNNREITLPRYEGTDDKQYRYNVDGTIVTVGASDGTYTFTKSDLNDIFVNRELTITREIFDPNKEFILSTVESLTDAFAKNNVPATFIPMEDASGEKLALVLRVEPTLAGVTMGNDLAMAIVKTGSVGIGGNVFFNGGTVSLQGLINALANSNFQLSKLAAIINADGTITDAEIEGYSQIATTEPVGGLLMESTITLGGKEMPLYVTMTDGGSTDTLKKLDSALTTVTNYADVILSGGTYQLKVSAPDTAYAYFAALLLLFDEADIGEMSDVQLSNAINRALDMVKPLFADADFNTTAVENALKEIGYNVDLSAYSSIFDTARKLVNYVLTNAERTPSGSTGSTYQEAWAFDSADLLSKLNNRFGLDQIKIGELTLLDMIEESKTGAKLSVDASITLTNIDKKYEAMVFDNSKTGLRKYTYTTDLTTTLNNVGDNAFIVLLSDVELDSAVTIPNKAFINLNGFTITGDMNAAANVRITDSVSGGGVDGDLSGFFFLTGGTYTGVIAETMLPNGYVKDANGEVSNKVYTIKHIDPKDDPEGLGKVVLELKADFLSASNIPTVKEYLAELAFDVAFNMFNKAAVSVEGNTVYSVEFVDVVDMISSMTTNELANKAIDILNTQGTSKVINMLLADLTDFGAIKTAVEGKTNIATYELTSKGWDIKPYVSDENYLTLDILPAESAKTTSLVVKIAEGEDTTALVELLENLDDAIDVGALSVEVSDISYDGGLKLDYSGEVDVAIDLSGDENYAVIIAASVAYANDALKTDLVAAINAYYADGDITVLRDALEKVTAAQFVAAVKSLAYNDFADMVAGLGIEADVTEAVELEASYAMLVEIGGKALNKLGINGSAVTLGKFRAEESFGDYSFERENIRNLDVEVSLKLFDDSKEPVWVDDADGKIEGFYFDGENIYLDVWADGVTVKEVVDSIDFGTTNVNVYGDTVALGNKDIVSNGCKVQVGGKSYTIVILGDVNGNGRNDAGDAVLIKRYYLGLVGLSKVQLLAANVNCNDRIDAGDAVKVAVKYTDWNEYESLLK